jgi:predicted nuclease of predicted toxin-antitoxin system
LRLLADENVPGVAVEALRARGHNVLWIRTAVPGSSDLEVLRLAERDNRVVFTFDKDFGDLALHRRVSRPPGVILFRVRPLFPPRLAQVVVRILESRDDWTGHFSVVEEERIRMVMLPE